MSNALGRYKRYPVYKDSGVEWVGDVPEDWKLLRLKRVLKEPLAYGANESAELVDRALPRYIRITDIRDDGSLRDDTFRSLPEPVAMPYLLEEGDLLFARSGATAGKTFRFDRSWGRAAHAGYLIRARLNDAALISRYLEYFARSKPYWDWVSSNFIQATIQNVSAERFAGLHVPVPTREEQDRVVAFLDRETAKIDALVVKKERLIAALLERRSALINRVITMGLDPHVSMRDSRVSWLGMIPRHWKTKRLWHLTPSDRRIMYGIVLPGPHVDGGVPIVKGGDVAEGRLRLDLLNRTTPEIESAYVRSRLRGGDLVFAIRGSIGEVAIVPEELTGANLTQDAARVAFTSKTNGLWLMFALKSTAVFSQLEAGALGATIKGINIRDLKRAVIPVPPPDEQAAIAKHLVQETSNYDQLTARVEQAVQKLLERRIALISAAVTGKIDVREEVA